MKAHSLIQASEVARYLYCGRAWGYDLRQGIAPTGGLLRRLRGISWLIIGPLVVGLVLFLQVGLEVAITALVASLVLFIIGRIILGRLRETDTLIIYHGTKAHRNHRTMVASGFGLAGKPDYLLHMDKGSVIPVLCKSNPAPDVPHEAHIMQVIAHCLLLSESEGKRPPYGVIRYGDGRTFEVDFDEDSVEALSQLMDEIETQRSANGLPARTHEERARCFACSQRQHCDQSLF